MTRDEFASYAINLGKSEGFCPGKDDVCFFAADPNGFFVGLLNGKKISTCSLVKYENKQAFLGYNILEKEFRGRGYGSKALKHALETVDDSYNIGLDAFIGTTGIYEKRGFEVVWNNRRYTINASEAMAITQTSESVVIKPVCEVDFENVIKYNASVFGCDRCSFLKEWVNAPHHKGFVAMDYSDNVLGFVIIREMVDGGFKFGPLFADSAQIACSLIKFSGEIVAKAAEGDRFILIDMIEANPEAIAIVEEIGCDYESKTCRMYTKGIPKDFLKEKVFGLTSVEIG